MKESKNDEDNNKENKLNNKNENLVQYNDTKKENISNSENNKVTTFSHLSKWSKNSSNNLNGFLLVAIFIVLFLITILLAWKCLNSKNKPVKKQGYSTNMNYDLENIKIRRENVY